jgi:Fe-S-cluster containining protein
VTTGHRKDGRVLERCTFASRLFERDLWIFTRDFAHIFGALGQTFNSKFPRHFLFANFRCLRCGQCCMYFMPVRVHSLEIKRWIGQRRKEILKHIWCFHKAGYCIDRTRGISACMDCDRGTMQIESQSAGKGCPFLRRVQDGSYYECCIHDVEPETCSGYLCHKSLPFAHLRWRSVDKTMLKGSPQGGGILA